MRKWLFLFLLFTALLFAGCSPGKNDSSAKPLFLTTSGGPVIAVGGETVTGDDIIGSFTERNGRFVALMERFKPMARNGSLERFKEQAGPELEQILITRLSNLLLYVQAKKELEGKGKVDEQIAKLVDKEVRTFVTDEFEGDYTRAQEYLERNEMNWKRFREQQKKSILTQYYISSQLPKDRLVTYSELLERYNQVKAEYFAAPSTIKFEMLDIQSSRLSVNDPNKSSGQLAREFADALVARIGAGEDFQVVADQFRAVSLIRFSEPVRPDSLARPYDVLARQAEEMQPGQVSEPIESPGGDRIFIMKLLDKQGADFKPLAEVQRQVVQIILAERRNRAVDELETKFRAQARLAEKDQFLNLCLEKIYRMSNS
ncbi:MAG TPA: peptidyl-prolyl cis-trans isomerase [Sedimentisphaerales bacterium]|nr:peptidyl-prolyl cis-trans isomerase [Sedimentisphaerales bacterium]